MITYRVRPWAYKPNSEYTRRIWRTICDKEFVTDDELRAIAKFIMRVEECGMEPRQIPYYLLQTGAIVIA